MDDGDGELMKCPETKMPCDGLNVGAGWDCEAHGCWKKYGLEDRDLEQRG